MSRALFSIVNVSLVAFTALTSGVAMATTTIGVDVVYKYDSANNCVTAIEVSVPDPQHQEPLHPKNVEISQKDLEKDDFAVQWNLQPASQADEADLNWKIEKLGTYSSSTKCKKLYEGQGKAVTMTCAVQKISQEGNSEIWTYDVIPVDDPKCCPVPADPAIIFRGGGGNPYLKPLVAAVVGAAVAFLSAFLFVSMTRKAHS